MRIFCRSAARRGYFQQPPHQIFRNSRASDRQRMIRLQHFEAARLAPLPHALENSRDKGDNYRLELGLARRIGAGGAIKEALATAVVKLRPLRLSLQSVFFEMMLSAPRGFHHCLALLLGK